MSSFAYILMGVGIFLTLIGLAAAGHLGPLGRLPGDILVSRNGFSVYAPITTGIIISAALTFIIWVISK